jgi:hypothetical protein
MDVNRHEPASGYTSSRDPITASALRNVTRSARHAGGVFLVDSSGDTVPIVAAMASEEGETEGCVLLYTTQP